MAETKPDDYGDGSGHVKCPKCLACVDCGYCACIGCGEAAVERALARVNGLPVEDNDGKRTGG